MKKCLLLVILIALGASVGCNRGKDVAISSGSAEQEAGPPQFPYINTGDVRAKNQLLVGWYGIEDGAWRWVGPDAVAILAVPKQSPVSFELKLFLPPDQVKRAGGPITVSVRINGQNFASETYTKDGGYTLIKAVPPGTLSSNAAKVEIHFDRTMTPGGEDRRVLAAIVHSIGFRQE